MQYDYRKLLGRIVEILGTQAKFAEALGLSEHTVSKKLNGFIEFRQREIAKSCEILDIKPEDIPQYFFTLKVQ